MGQELLDALRAVPGDASADETARSAASTAGTSAPSGTPGAASASCPARPAATPAPRPCALSPQRFMRHRAARQGMESGSCLSSHQTIPHFRPVLFDHFGRLHIVRDHDPRIPALSPFKVTSWRPAGPFHRSLRFEAISRTRNRAPEERSWLQEVAEAQGSQIRPGQWVQHQSDATRPYKLAGWIQR